MQRNGPIAVATKTLCSCSTALYQYAHSMPTAQLIMCVAKPARGAGSVRDSIAAYRCEQRQEAHDSTS
jgi:hypothetical protein